MTRLRLLSIAVLAAFTAGLAMALLGIGDQTGLEAESASAATAQEPVTGTLSQPNYTVIALAPNGEAKTALAGPDGSFSLTPTAETVTLHLRAPDGTYAGPITLAESEAAIAQRELKVSDSKAKVENSKTRVENSEAKVRQAKKQVKRATKKVKKAKKKLRKASGKQAIRKARKRLKRAKQKLRKAKKKLRQAKKNLSKARAQLQVARNELQAAQDELQAARERQTGERAILGVRSASALGPIQVDSAAGYAKAEAPTVSQWESWVDTERWAQANGGVPIGAGNFGFVRSTELSGSGVGDLDRDGVSDPLDVDDNGDVVLDDAERPAGGQASATGAQASATDGTFLDGSRLHSNTMLDAHEFGANVNGGSTEGQIAAAQATWGMLGTFMIGIDPGSGELDCGGLTYCSPGGTGRLFDRDILSPHRFDHPPFPECCDLDGDGFGSLEDSAELDGSGGNAIFHGATVDQIGTGDVLILRATVDGVETESATTVGFAFSTPAVFAAYDDGQGNSATFSYPPSCTFETDPDCVEPVRAGSNGDVVLTMSAWRPQRGRIESEPGQGRWIDMGNLGYTVTVHDFEAETPRNVACPQSSLSESDDNLEPPTGPSLGVGPYSDGGGFWDLLSDQPANPANTFTFTVNLTQCYASNGLNLETGDAVILNLGATAASPTIEPWTQTQWTFEVQS